MNKIFGWQHPKPLNADERKLSEETIRDHERRRALVWALRSRVLTDDEIAEVKRLGADLLVVVGSPYFQADIERRFDDLLLQQFRLRMAAEKAVVGQSPDLQIGDIVKVLPIPKEEWVKAWEDPTDPVPEFCDDNVGCKLAVRDLGPDPGRKFALLDLGTGDGVMIIWPVKYLAKLRSVHRKASPSPG